MIPKTDGTAKLEEFLAVRVDLTKIFVGGFLAVCMDLMKILLKGF